MCPLIRFLCVLQWILHILYHENTSYPPTTHPAHRPLVETQGSGHTRLLVTPAWWSHTISGHTRLVDKSNKNNDTLVAVCGLFLALAWGVLRRWATLCRRPQGAALCRRPRWTARCCSLNPPQDRQCGDLEGAAAERSQAFTADNVIRKTCLAKKISIVGLAAGVRAPRHRYWYARLALIRSK